MNDIKPSRRNLANAISIYNKTQTTETNHNQESSLFSLKPQWLIVPKDISPIAIFQSTKREISEKYPKTPKKIDLTQISSRTRMNMISKMKGFINKYRLSPYTFFLAVYYMDLILAKRAIISLDKIALGCLLLSVKFHEIDGRSPTISKFKDFNENFVYCKEDIIKIEIECLKKLGYELIYPHPIHFIQLLLLNGIIFNKDVTDTSGISLSMYSLPTQIMEYIVEDNGTYLQQDPLQIAFACVALSRELYKCEKWNRVLENIYGVSFVSFENVYNYAKE